MKMGSVHVLRIAGISGVLTPLNNGVNGVGSHIICLHARWHLEQYLFLVLSSHHLATAMLWWIRIGMMAGWL